MVVEKESVRYFASERELIMNESALDPGGAWAQLATVTTAIQSEGFLVVKGGFDCDGTGVGGVRLKLTYGGTDYYPIGKLADTEASHTFFGVIYIPERISIVFSFEGRECTAEVDAAWIKVGFTAFKDMDGTVLTADMGNTVAAGATTKVVDQTVVPTKRMTVIGQIWRTTLRFQVLVICQDAQRGRFVTTHGALTDYEISLEVEGEDIAWQTSSDDASSTCYGAAYAEAVVDVPADETIDVELFIKNNDAGAHDYDVYYSFATCPWVFAPDYVHAVLVNIPPGSTVNLVSEPLDDDPSKSIGLGHYTPYGDDKVYDEQTGANIISYSNVLADLPSSGLYLLHKGFRGCISVITADRRG